MHTNRRGHAVWRITVSGFRVREHETLAVFAGKLQDFHSKFRQQGKFMEYCTPQNTSEMIVFGIKI